MFRCAFTIESDTRYLAVLRGLIPAAFAAAGMGRAPRAARVACTLALIEAVDNAIFHAHRRARGLPICVSVALSPKRISIEVADCGRGIGRRPGVCPDSMETHGRGLFLIHRLMPAVASRMKRGRHTLSMVYPL